MNIITLTLLFTVWLIQAGPTFKEIPDLVALGYTVSGNTPVQGDFTYYDVSYGETFIADVAIYKDNNAPDLLAVFNVQADDDTHPDKLHFRDIELGVWKYSIDRQAENLNALKYMWVYEPALLGVTHEVYELMGVPETQDLMVLRDHHSENEGKAYDLLHNTTPFGSGAQKMTDEFEEMQGKEVEAFGYESLGAVGIFHFTVYFVIPDLHRAAGKGVW